MTPKSKLIFTFMALMAIIGLSTVSCQQFSGGNTEGFSGSNDDPFSGRNSEGFSGTNEPSRNDRDGFLYFAYGSNLWTERIRINNPNVVKKATGVLDNYKLEFAHYSNRWQGAVASIKPENGAKVQGVLWQLKDLKALDKQEGVGIGIYERFKVRVKSQGKYVDAWTYKVTDATKQRAIATYGANLKPSVAYKDAIISGAVEHNLPASYISQLRKIPTNNN